MGKKLDYVEGVQTGDCLQLTNNQCLVTSYCLRQWDWLAFFVLNQYLDLIHQQFLSSAFDLLPVNHFHSIQTIRVFLYECFMDQAILPLSK